MTSAERQRRSRARREVAQWMAEAAEQSARAEARSQAKRAERAKAEARRLRFEGGLAPHLLHRMRSLEELISRRTPYAVSADPCELTELRYLVDHARAWLGEWQALVDRDWMGPLPDFDPDSEPEVMWRPPESLRPWAAWPGWDIAVGERKGTTAVPLAAEET